MYGKTELRPPPPAHPFAPDPRVSRLKFIALITFFVLVIAAIGVVFLLPRGVNNATDAVVAPTPGAAEKAPAVSQATAAAERRRGHRSEARKLLKEALKLQADLERDGVKIWGAAKLVTSYPDAQGMFAEADRQFDNDQFERAAALYQETVAKFQQLQKSKQRRFGQAMQAGGAALDGHDGETAAGQFEIALAAQPDNAQAADGLRRARSLGQVLALIEQGVALAAGGALEAARRVFAEAVALDGAFPPARDHLARTLERIKENAYRRSISTALAALHDRDYAGSEKALETARSLRPDARELRDIASQIRVGRQGAQLARLRHQAGVHARNEEWPQALTLYEAALLIDSQAAFALSGKLTAQKFLHLNQQIDRYLTDTDRLSSPEPLAHAAALGDAAATATAGPRLRDKAAKLKELVAKAAKPIAVLLRSDSETDVGIQRVGRFGRFSEHRLELRPGAYTAIGSRPGYRDVRVPFRVPLSGTEMIVIVRCEEPI